MQTLEVIGYVSTFFMGVVLGLLGAGGSILTVPILVYLFKLQATEATSYSLGVVGAVSLFGLRSYWVRNSVALKTAVQFFVPSFVSVLLARKVVLPKIPTEMHFLNFVLTKNLLILVLFSVVMIFAAQSMLWPSKTTNKKAGFKIPLPGRAIFVGTLTGLVGSGGGFLIVPALSQQTELTMPVVMGTSLLIITLNSLSGFALDILAAHSTIQIPFFLSLLVLPIFGILIGARLNQVLPAQALKKLFGLFVLISGVGILLQQTLQ